MAYTVPQSVLNYFKDYGPLSSKDPQFTDENGFIWIPQYEDVASDGNNRLVGYRTGTAPGIRPGITKDTNLYFDTSGNFSHVNTDDPGWLNPLTGILAVASLGLGAGALAAGGEAAGAAGAGAAAGGGAATGADLAAFYGGLDGAATLGGGASVAGGSSLGALGGAGAAGAGAGYLGDYTAAGYGGLDAQSAATMGGGYTVDGGAIGGAGAMGAGGAGGGTAPPANPYATGGTPPPANPNVSGGGMSSLMNPDYMQLAGTALGALGGAQGVENSATSSRSLPGYLQGPVAGDLIPRTQGLLGMQMPAAGQAGNQMLSKGSGLLAQTAPDTATNPYATGILNDMQRRNGEFIDQRLQGIAGNSVGVGGLGGSRQGVAQAQAISQGADNFAGQGFNFMGGLYNQDQNRLRQDWTLGAGLMGQGLNTQFAPLQNASSIYSPFSGFGTNTQTQQQGGGWQGALGGALGAAQFGKNMGWWG